MTNRSKGHKKRLRERFIKSGLQGFHDYEILELMLSYSLIRKDTKELAKKLIDEFGSFNRILNSPLSDLEAVKGVGPRTAVLLALFKEVGSFYLKEKIKQKHYLGSLDEVLDYLRHSLRGVQQEVFKAIYLDVKNCIVDEETLQVGTLDRSAIYPREVIKRAFKNNAKSLIFVHNHPSGDNQPSDIDKRITQKLLIAGYSMDINVHDHIIIAGNDYFSMAENDLIKIWRNKLENFLMM